MHDCSSAAAAAAAALAGPSPAPPSASPRSNTPPADTAGEPAAWRGGVCSGVPPAPTGVFAGTAYGVYAAGTFDGLVFFLALLATICVHAGSNVLNDVSDESIGTW